MIKASDLRIGNWVNESGINKQVGSGDIMYLDGEDDTDFGDMFLGITLTPEILEKCGCLKTIKFGGNASYRIWSLNISIFYIEFSFKDNEELFYQVFRSSTGKKYFRIIKYLHEFQNLVYWLTGEELTINL